MNRTDFHRFIFDNMVGKKTQHKKIEKRKGTTYGKQNYE